MRAIHYRHKQVQEDSGWILFCAYSILYPLQSLLPVCNADRLVSLKEEHIEDYLLSRGMIFYHENERALTLFLHLGRKWCRCLLHNRFPVLVLYILPERAERTEK